MEGSETLACQRRASLRYWVPDRISGADFVGKRNPAGAGISGHFDFAVIAFGLNASMALVATTGLTLPSLAWFFR